MIYESNREEFKYALNYTFKNDEFIQDLFFKSYQLIAYLLNDDDLQKKERICNFSEDDIYDYYYYFFSENSKLFLKEIERIKSQNQYI